ncbi:MAG: carbohydrate kinase family protein [Patescibacteria group bacterium]|nr:carbohydrate kinase family protein [Patescibacteria group bacterium]
MKKVLVCGSLAFDHIMNFNDRFKNHILPDKIHILNVCFGVDKLSKEFGGTAGNIAYNLKLLGIDPIIFASAGKDFNDYKLWLDRNKIKTNYIKYIKEYTASCHIITDLDDNQITFFHGGAMLHNHLSLRKIVRQEKVELAICAPDCHQGMLLHTKELQDMKIPYIFDPGQGIGSYSGSELLRMAKGSLCTILNDYEFSVFQQKTKLSKQQVLRLTKYLIITLGPKGSEIYFDNKKYIIPCAKPKKILDPTGAGDAYRAGLIYGLLNNYSADKMGKVGACSAVYTVEKYGTQTHKFNFNNFKIRFNKNFKEKI